MRYKHPLKRILRENRSLWDGDWTRPAVRKAFDKALECGTAALGAELYSSGVEERTVFHTCKGRACSSCGARATSRWQRERWAALPDVPYKGITFTMPNVLWPLFRDRQLARLLPILAAKTVEAWVRAKFGVAVGVIAIPHTFNGRLEFNAHVHVMVTAGGLKTSGDWVPSVYYDIDSLTRYWRKGVIRLLRAGLRAGRLITELPAQAFEEQLNHQENRWWSVKLQSLGSKEHFLRYAGQICQASAHCPTSHYRDQSTTDQILGKRQKAPSSGDSAPYTKGIPRGLGTTHTRALRARCSVIRTVCSSGNREKFSSRVCHSGPDSEATPESCKLESVYHPRLRLGPPP